MADPPHQALVAQHLPEQFSISGLRHYVARCVFPFCLRLRLSLLTSTGFGFHERIPRRGGRDQGLCLPGNNIQTTPARNWTCFILYNISTSEDFSLHFHDIAGVVGIKMIAVLGTASFQHASVQSLTVTDCEQSTVRVCDSVVALFITIS